MKHKHLHKHYKHLNRKWKRLAIAVAGAALMSTAILPGLPAATAHASPITSSRTSQKAANTNRASDPEQKNDSAAFREIPLQSKSQSVQKTDLKQTKDTSSMQKQQQASTDRPIKQKSEQNYSSGKIADISASSSEKNNQMTPPPQTHPDSNKTPNIQPNDKAVETNNPPAPSTPSAENAPTNYKEILDVTATAYAPGPHDNEQWGNKTYTGTQVRPGIIAVDPKIIPLGSRVYIQYPDGHGVYATAEDTGGAIKGNRIDIAKWSVNEAEDFGIQNVKVYIVDKPKNS